MQRGMEAAGGEQGQLQGDLGRVGSKTHLEPGSLGKSFDLRHWHRLPREAVDGPFVEGFKAKLDGALSNLV